MTANPLGLPLGVGPGRSREMCQRGEWWFGVRTARAGAGIQPSTLGKLVYTGG